MRRLFLLFAMLFLMAAFVFTAYGYYILVRSPEVEIGIIEFIVKAMHKVARFLITP